MKDILKKMNEKWKKQKPILQRKEAIRKEKAEITKDRKHLTSTKKYIVFIFISATVIEMFTGGLMLYQMHLAKKSIEIGLLYVPDMAPQIGLITAVVGEAIAFAVYCTKSFFENREQYGRNNNRHDDCAG